METPQIELSPRFKVLPEQWKKWLQNQVEFLKPLLAFEAVLYLSPIISGLQSSSHVATLQDFIPSALVINSMILYLLNAAFDLFRKWAGVEKVVVNK